MTTCPMMLSSCLRAKEGNDFNLGQNCSIALSGNCLIPLCSCWLMSLTLSSQCPFYGLPLPESTPGIRISLDRCAGLPFFLWCGIGHLEGWLEPTVLFIQSEWWWPTPSCEFQSVMSATWQGEMLSINHYEPGSFIPLRFSWVLLSQMPFFRSYI